MNDDDGSASRDDATPPAADTSTAETDESSATESGTDGGTTASQEREAPTPEETDAAPVPDPGDGPVAAVQWFLRTDDQTVAFVREAASSALAVVLVGLLLFTVSGVWPPMVAVSSGSMEPHLQPGDLVFVVEEHRYGGSGVEETGVVPYEQGRELEYRTFGDYGEVIVFAPPDRSGPPIIHRARFWVSAGENWYDRADDRYIDAAACEAASPQRDLANCPAPHAGFITLGDANARYDQASGLAGPVRPAWIRGTAEVRVPYLGCVRLWVSGDPPAACRP